MWMQRHVWEYGTHHVIHVLLYAILETRVSTDTVWYTMAHAVLYHIALVKFIPFGISDNVHLHLGNEMKYQSSSSNAFLYICERMFVHNEHSSLVCSTNFSGG